MAHHLPSISWFLQHRLRPELWRHGGEPQRELKARREDDRVELEAKLVSEELWGTHPEQWKSRQYFFYWLILRPGCVAM
ncbi:rCG33894 [Rattus norvegicus]|uniref:RCG33894 n=1 Tax=Rattus norvegicus TaxID=10116 RepID=A6HJZ2_RAT|nr:rCG33894 [Rattus norvegicus]